MSLSRTQRRILAGVVRHVNRMLRLCDSIFLRDFAGAYEFRVTRIRFSRKVQSLQVRASFGWSTVWNTERLINQHGDCLFESPAFGDTVEFLETFKRNTARLL